MNKWIKRFLCCGVLIIGLSTTIYATIFFTSPTNSIVDNNHIPMSGRLLSGKAWIQGERIKPGPTGKFKKNSPCKVGKNSIWIHLEDSYNDHYKKIYFCLAQFKDAEFHWAEGVIKRLATVFEFTGRGGTKFYKPNAPITRAELAYMLVKIKKYPLVEPKTPSFKDNYPTDWAYAYIETATQKGFMTGTSKVHFSQNGFVTRAELAHILVNYSDVPKIDVPIIKAQDLMTSFWAHNYIQQVAALGVWPEKWINSQYFYPYRPVTRGEIAQIVIRLPKIKETVETFFEGSYTVALNRQGIVNKSTNRQYKWQKNTGKKIKRYWVQRKKRSKGENLQLFIDVKKGAPISRVKINLVPFNLIHDYELRNDGAGGDKKRRDTIFTGEWPIEEGVTSKKCWVSFYNKDTYLGKEKISLESSI